MDLTKTLCRYHSICKTNDKWNMEQIYKYMWNFNNQKASLFSFLELWSCWSWRLENFLDASRPEWIHNTPCIFQYVLLKHLHCFKETRNVKLIVRARLKENIVFHKKEKKPKKCQRNITLQYRPLFQTKAKLCSWYSFSFFR